MSIPGRTIGVVLVLLAVAMAALATDPAAPRLKGKVLLLDNDRALEGDIERQGEQYCIRRGTGELWVPAAKGQCLCASWEEAFAKLMARTNSSDADERLRLARWCHAHGLRGKALEQVKAALAISPGSVEAKKLLASYQNVSPGPAKTTATATPPSPATPPPGVDLSADCQALFATRVQPILLNACASCHANGRGGDFQLIRWAEGGQRGVTKQNLAAVLPLINCQNPSLSPLLLKAASVHGHGTQPPLPGGRKSVPFQTLEQWVRLVLTNNPHLGPQGPTATTVFGPPAPAEVKFPSGPPAVGTASPPVQSTPPGLAGAKTAPVVSRTVPVPATSNEHQAAVAADPFDPAIFNRQMHPPQKP